MTPNRILAGMCAASVVALLALGPEPVTAQSQSSNPSGSSSAQGAAQADSDYRVGAGDVIEVSVWKEPEVSTTVVVRPDGKISIPLISDLGVSGKTPMQIQDIVAEKLAPFIKLPNVTVTVKEIRSKKCTFWERSIVPAPFQSHSR